VRHFSSSGADAPTSIQHKAWFSFPLCFRSDTYFCEQHCLSFARQLNATGILLNASPQTSQLIRRLTPGGGTHITMKKKRGGSNPRRNAMRLVAYIRAAGAEPVPFRHDSFRSYRADLERQYSAIRSGLGRELGRQARIAGRALVRLKSLQGAAGDVVPIAPLSTVKLGRKHSGQSGLQDSALRTISAPAISVPTTPLSSPTKRDVRNCRRKLRHVNHLSALLHASRLGDPDLLCYECPVCMGIHVGHDRRWVKLRAIHDELTSIETRLSALETEFRQLQHRRTALLQDQAGLVNPALEQDEVGSLPSVTEDIYKKRFMSP
jgi:hypothetical protein